LNISPGAVSHLFWSAPRPSCASLKTRWYFTSFPFAPLFFHYQMGKIECFGREHLFPAAERLSVCCIYSLPLPRGLEDGRLVLPSPNIPLLSLIKDPHEALTKANFLQRAIVPEIRSVMCGKEFNRYPYYLPVFFSILFFYWVVYRPSRGVLGCQAEDISVLLASGICSRSLLFSPRAGALLYTKKSFPPSRC